MGQVAIVTGGSSGIGAAAAEYLAAHGCTVYEFSRHEKSGGSASVHHVTADVPVTSLTGSRPKAESR